MEYTLVVDKHDEDGKVIGHGSVVYTKDEQANGEDNLDSVWITVTDMDGCYPDTVRQAFKDEYMNDFIEEINLPL